MMPRKSLQERIDQYAVSVLPSGCLIWLGHADAEGYGIAFMTREDGGKNRRVHRLTYEDRFGAIPPGMMVCHRCDIPSCINPDHLFLGSADENSRDKVRKGRAIPGPRDNSKSRNPNCKLSPESVESIRARHVFGARSGPNCTAALAREFSVNRTQIQKIARGQQW